MRWNRILIIAQDTTETGIKDPKGRWVTVTHSLMLPLLCHISFFIWTSSVSRVTRLLEGWVILRCIGLNPAILHSVDMANRCLWMCLVPGKQQGTQHAANCICSLHIDQHNHWEKYTCQIPGCSLSIREKMRRKHYPHKPGRKHPPACLLIEKKLKELSQVKLCIDLGQWLHLQQLDIVWTNEDLAL